MLGISRKRFISVMNKDSEPKDRLGGTISTIIQKRKNALYSHKAKNHFILTVNYTNTIWTQKRA